MIAADDVVLAIDAATGKTKWKAVFADKGANNPPSKRGGWAVTPVYHDGTVFSVGTTGRIYALDAATGKVRWESNVGPAHEQREKAKRQALANPSGGLARLQGMEASPLVADGVLIVPTYAESADLGLIGYDAATGKRLWEVPKATFRMGAPAIWRHEGRQYVLAGASAGHLQLIDAKSGKVLWKRSGLGPQVESLAPAGKYVLVDVNPAAKVKGDAPALRKYGAVRLDVAKPEIVWKLPDRREYQTGSKGDGQVYRRVSPRGEFFDLLLPNEHHRDELKARWLTVNAADGKIVSYHTLADVSCPWPGVFVWIGSRGLFNQDAAHCENRFQWIELAEGKPRPLRGLWHPSSKQEDATGYMTPMQTPILDGFLYLRTSVGMVRCYDLRKQPEGQ
ncbi:MAG TPA: PQQ-binding-like beta-propeller repeat protein [Gemmataceae bacterium]